MRIALVLLLLAGCASPEQIAARQAYEAQQQEAARTAYRERLMASCESIGYTRNTDQWRQCIMQLHAQNQAQQTAYGAALIHGTSSRPLPPCPPGVIGGYQRGAGRCY